MRVRTLIPLVALAAVAGACASDTAADPTPTPTPTGPPPAEAGWDGGEGRLVRSDDGSLTVDPVEVLDGQEARDAAEEDGEIGAGEDLPNDVYVRDADATTVTVPMADTASVELYDCSSGCELREVDMADWLDGTVSAFNGEYAVYAFEVTDGFVSAVAEIYLP